MRNTTIISIRIVEKLSNVNFLVRFDLAKERTRSDNNTFIENTLKNIIPDFNLKGNYTPRVLGDDFTKINICVSNASVPMPQSNRRLDYITFGDIGVYVYEDKTTSPKSSRLTGMVDDIPILSKLLSHLLKHLSEEGEIALFSKGYTIGRVNGISLE